MGCEIDFVDYQKIGSCDARSALGRNFVTCGDVNDINCQIGQLRRKCRGKIVAARFEIARALRPAVRAR
jgi:hypothetical protein